MPPTDPSAADGSVDEPSPPSADPGSRGFPRGARLLDGRSYDAVFGDNRRLADRHWTVLVHRRTLVPAGEGSAEPSDGSPAEGAPDGGRGTDAPAPIGRETLPPPARLGLAVAKKRARRAVDRNRIKRVARESFRHVRAGLAGLDIVVMNRDAAKDATAPELRRSLDALWSRLLRQSPDDSRESAGPARRRRGRGDGAPPGAGRTPAGGDPAGTTRSRANGAVQGGARGGSTGP